MSTRPDFHSGNWTGFYLESHRSEPGWMHLYLTCDPQGAIQGEGVDYVGPWSLRGTFDRSSGRCEWIKFYVGKHRVEYSGLLGPDGIEGTWRIKPFLSGSFRIWPEYRADLTNALLHAKQPLAPAPPAPSLYEELESAEAL